MVLPTGTVTFLLTDIEGSTKLWQWHEDVMGRVVERHDEVIAKAVADHGGAFVKSKGEGDSTFSVFTRPSDAVAAAIDAQRALGAEVWPSEIDLRVRAALHTGEAELRDTDYYGTTVNRCARLRAAAHGGQVICSQATEELAADSLPDGVSLRDLGTHRLRDLTRPERIYQLCHADLEADFPVVRSLNAFLNNLPMQRTTFIGREEELSALTQLLTEHRLVTLTGVGGCGKTRLGLQAAAEELDSFPDGVFFVDLAPVTDPAVLPSAAATAVGLSANAMTGGSGRSVTDDLVEFLSMGTSLLVLDNCEHLIDACGELADVLVERCPNLTILATSREALGVAGEQTCAVPSLSVPKPGETTGDCVALFCDRATAARPGFDLTADTGDAVAEICRRLDGIPLAIELAAAQVPHLSPRQIADRLNDRFKLLTGPRRRVQRQQTLAAALDWSYELLEESERRLLTRLAVFPGSFTLEAAEAVCSSRDIDRAIVSLLRSLVAKSLVLTEESGDHLRYRLLETVRLYAEEKLLASGEADAFRTMHRDYYLSWVETMPLSRLLAIGRPRLVEDHHNIRAALEWSAAEERFDLLARLAARSSEVWILNHADEGARWLDLALQHRDNIAQPELVACWAAAAWVANVRMDGALMVRGSEEAVAAADGEPSWWLVLALGQLSVGWSFVAVGGDPDARAKCIECGESSVEVAKAIADGERGTAVELAELSYGMALALLGDLEASERHLRLAMSGLSRDEGDFVLTVVPASRRSIVLHMLGRRAEALEDGRLAAEITLEYAASLGSVFTLADPGWTLFMCAPYALALVADGRTDEGREQFETLLTDRRGIKIPGFMGEALVLLAAACAVRGDWNRVSILLAVSRREAVVRTPPTTALYQYLIAKTKAELDRETIDTCRTRGLEMPVDDAIEYGLAGL